MKSRATAKAEKERPGRGNITAEVVLETSAVLFFERGFDRTSMNDIAAALGVTKPSVYYYFPSKDAILTACIDHAGNAFNGQLDKIAKSGLTPSEKVVAVVRAYYGALRNNIHRVLILADSRTLSEPGAQAVFKAKGRINATFEKMLKEAIATGEFRDLDTRQATNAVFGMFNWMAVWRGEASYRSFDIDEAFLDFILHGLKQKKP